MKSIRNLKRIRSLAIFDREHLMHQIVDVKKIEAILHLLHGIARFSWLRSHLQSILHVLKNIYKTHCKGMYKNARYELIELAKATFFYTFLVFVADATLPSVFKEIAILKNRSTTFGLSKGGFLFFMQLFTRT